MKRAQQQLRLADTVAARAELADLYFEAGKYSNCESEYQKLLEGEPQNIEALYHIGMCRLKMGDFAAALEYLRQVVDKNIKLRFGLAWLRYTDCLIAVGKRDEALEERKKLSRSFPRPLTEFAYADLLSQAGQKDKEREALEEMLATSQDAPREDRVWIKKGRTLLRSLHV